VPLPDKYANEPTVELPEDKVAAWRAADDAAKRWKEHAEKLKAELIAMIGDAHAVIVDDQKVVTYRPSQKFAESRLLKEYPELTRHFLREQTTLVFDLESFLKRHGEIAEQYRVRQFRWVEE
jgi:hypothetical protein